jgi:RimJ/RimL family protein N-acetyltransferase
VIETKRLKLIPATVALVRAEIADRDEFARLLGASVPDNWPPEILADALPTFLGWLEAPPDRAGWFSWYALARGDGPVPPVLVASGGFTGPPQDGMVEIGHSVLPQYEGQGYATEMVAALVQWATEQAGVARVTAETERANPASVRVLLKGGFIPAGAVREAGGARFELAVNT